MTTTAPNLFGINLQTPGPDKNTYEIDFKVYEGRILEPLTVWLPTAMYSGEVLKEGYHTIDAFMTKEELEEFETAIRKHAFHIKIIGITQTSF